MLHEADDSIKISPVMLVPICSDLSLVTMKVPFHHLRTDPLDTCVTLVTLVTLAVYEPRSREAVCPII